MADTHPSSSSETVATLKLLLIGSSGTGKSSLLMRFVDGVFLAPDEISATIGVDFKVKVIDVEGKKYKLTIWDTAGQERFRTLTSSYYRGAQGVILVYDVSNRDSFNDLQTWFNELDTYCSSKEVVRMIVGNKVDKESSREVSRQEGQEFARKLQTLFVECSAKTKLGVQQAFDELVQQIIDTPSLWQKQAVPNVRLQPAETAQENGGCAC
ncbi:Ras- protein Rab-18 [Podila epicladia]|uniref:small monomeric GTPase n=1 Tax=Podila minutissima TaxID=64525 RepID=A0A9P5SBM9_9FUNG|nr:Ras- protein Rab-18 [Podila minutissima]KAG0088327.1 Ras- protein Rab-18 [Podila epicladia]KAG0089876.1 Ras- protein Rab-18 [Podila epicladia]